VWKKVTTLRG